MMRTRIAGCAAFAMLLPAAPARAAEQPLSAPGVHVLAGTLVDGPSGRPAAAVWSETARDGARLRVAFAGPDGVFAPPRIILRTRLPVVALGAAATPSGGVLVVGAHLRRGGRESVVALTATPASAGRVVTLGHGTVVGRPPSVAVDDRGDALVAWEEAGRAIVARQVAGHWRRLLRFRSAGGAPVVAAAPDGTAAALVRRARGRIDLVQAHRRPTSFWNAGARRLACCALLGGPGGTLLAAWGEGRRVRVVTGLPPRTVLLARTRDEVEDPPIGALGPDGDWAIAWSDAGGRTAVALGGPAQAARTQALPRFRFAPLSGAAVGEGGAAALVASFFGVADVASRPARGAPLQPRTPLRGEPLGVGLTPAGPLVLVVRYGESQDELVALRS